MEVNDLIKKIQSAKTEAHKDSVSDDGLLRLQEVAAKYDGEYRLIWSDELKKKIDALPKKSKHMSGMTCMDDLMGGLGEQMLIGVGAHSGHGKTAMGLFLLKQYEYLNPIMIPLEQSASELIEQRSDNGQFVPRFLSPEKEEARVQPDWIEERIVEGIAKHNSKLIVIDHLGYVDPNNEHSRLTEPLQIERKLQTLKFLAKKWNVIIVILIHIVQLEESTPPSLLSLKGSSAIRQECDKVILLWRKNEMAGKVRIYRNETLFSLQKNRATGKNGNIGLTFDFKTGNYLSTDVARGWVEAMEETAQQQMDVDDEFNS